MTFLHFFLSQFSTQFETNYIIQYNKLKDDLIQHRFFKLTRSSKWQQSDEEKSLYRIFIKKTVNWLHFTKGKEECDK